MASYTKETALYNTTAIATDISNAGKKATNYISTDSSGLMVYDGTNGQQTPSSPTSTTNNVFIDSDSVDIRTGSTALASFGSTVLIGKSSGKNVYIDNNSVYIRNGTTALATFGSTVTIGGSSGNNVYIDSDSVDIRNGTTILATFGSTILLGGSSGNNVYIDSDSVDIRNGTTVLATFGSTVQIGKTADSHIVLQANSIDFYKGSSDLLRIAADIPSTGPKYTHISMITGTRESSLSFGDFSTDAACYASLEAHSGSRAYATLSAQASSNSANATSIHISAQSQVASGHSATISASAQTSSQAAYARLQCYLATLQLSYNSCVLGSDSTVIPFHVYNHIYMDSNNTSIFGTRSSGTTGINLLAFNSSDQFILGYGLYNSSFGRTYLEGNNISLLSKNEIYLSPGTEIGITFGKHIDFSRGDDTCTCEIYAGKGSATNDTRNTYYNVSRSDSYHSFYVGGAGIIYIYNDHVTMNKRLSVGGTLTASDKLTVSSGGLAVTGASTFSTTVTAGGKLTVSSGGLAVTGASTFSTTVTISGRLINKYAYDNTTTYATNMYVGSTGYVYRTTNTSSKRYKNSIASVKEKSLDPRRLYDIEVVQFKYNEDYFTNKEDPRYGKPLIGFVAEQVLDVYPIAVDVVDGKAEAWHPNYIIPPMLALIQEQKKEIDELKSRVDALAS